MAQLFFFCLQIPAARGGGRYLYRYSFGDFKAVTFEADYFARVIRHKMDGTQAQVAEYLRSYPVVAQVGGKTEGDIGLDGVQSLFLLKMVRLKFIGEAYAPAFLVHVEHYSLPFFLDGFKSGVKLFSAIAPQRMENIACNAR